METEAMETEAMETEAMETRQMRQTTPDMADGTKHNNFSFSLPPEKLSFKLPGLPEPDPAAETVKEENEDEKHSIRVSHRYGHHHLSRKATSEAALSDALDWHFREGDCYHCFSWGDVDALTFFKHVLRQQRVLYLALST